MRKATAKKYFLFFYFVKLNLKWGRKQQQLQFNYSFRRKLVRIRQPKTKNNFENSATESENSQWKKEVYQEDASTQKVKFLFISFTFTQRINYNLWIQK